MMEAAGVSALLLDSRDAGNAAAGGGAILEQMDAGSIRQIRSFFSGEIILGGGLTAANIRETVRVLRPDMADVMTGAETSPGRKSAELVSALVRALEN
jgi:phosphoribosylanthranilate isomerase